MRKATAVIVGAGHAGLDWSVVRPMTPVNAVPCGYVSMAMRWLVRIDVD